MVRQTNRLITPTEATQVTQAVTKLQPASALKFTQKTAPTVSFNKQRLIREQYKNNKEVQTFLSDYNDPTELNSYIDALTNRAAVSEKFGDTWGTISTVSGTVSVLSFATAIILAALAPVTGGATAPAAAVAAKVGTAAAVPSIPAAVDVTVEKGIKPILAGKPKEALLNTMMNLGETMDFAANPIKGLVLEGGEGFLKGAGLTNEGRINYDYDTGFFLTDMLLETISDPLNWIDFGASIAMKGALKPGAKQAADTVAENIVDAAGKAGIKEVTAESTEQISKELVKTTTQVSKEWAEATAENFTSAAKKLAKKAGKNFNFLSTTEKNSFRELAKKKILNDGRTKIQQALNRKLRKLYPDLSESQLNQILKTATRTTKSAQTLTRVISSIEDITMDTLSTQTIKAIANLQHYSNSYQRFMTKSAMLSSGYGLGVELAKEGWTGIKAWANNHTLNKLTKAQVFDRMNGLDITKYDAAKNIWEASYKYTSDLTGDIIDRDMNSFYVFMSQQLNRDKQYISQILRESPTAIKKSAALDAQIKNIYGIDFKQYIELIEEINTKENGLFEAYVSYLKSIPDNLNLQAKTVPLGAKVTNGAKLFKTPDLEHANVIKQLQKATKGTHNIAELPEKIYALKLNNAYVNAMLINDPIIGEALLKISSDENIGAMLNKIIGDINSLTDDVAAQIPVCVRTIKQAGTSFINIKALYDEVASIVLPNIRGIKSDDFKRYIIDQIFGQYKTVNELLAEFENTTLPALKNGLETMLADKGFKFKDYPAIEEQIAGVYKRFLQAQSEAGIDNIGATIVEDFTKSVEDLINYFPDYKIELSEIGAANDQIKLLLDKTRQYNLEQLNAIFTETNTIFDVTKLSTRALSDAGLALRTVGIKKNLDLFEFTQDMSGNLVLAADRLGKSLNRLKENLAQYTTYFTSERLIRIDAAYTAMYNNILTKQTVQDIGAFALLKLTNDPFQQFAQLIEFNKLTKNKELDKQFKDLIFEITEGTDVYGYVLNPSKLMTTDFAWEAMAQSAWIAEKQLNESIINGITAFDNLALNSKKITNDFYATRELLSANKVDRPKMLQQERYYKAAARVNEMLTFVEDYYKSLFDKVLADTEIEQLRKILNDFPELKKNYENLVDRLEMYWRGELKFQQDPKYLKGTKPDYKDEFTPFWEEIQAMNIDIQKTLLDYNSSLYEDFKSSRKLFNRAEWDKRKIHFDKEVWAERRVKWDPEEWNKRKLKFDKEAFKKRLVKFDKTEWGTRQVRKFDIEELRTRFKTFSIEDVPLTADMTDAQRTAALYEYKQQVKDYNEVIYDLYKKDLKADNAAALEEYLQELNTKNNQIYEDFYSKKNQIRYEQYAESIQTQNDYLFQEYVDEIRAANDPIYKEYISEIREFNDQVYQDYLSLKVKYTPVTPWDPCKKQQEFNKAISKASASNAKSVFYNLFNLSSDELINELAYRHRFITFLDNDISDNSQLRAMFNKLKKNLPESVKVIKDENTQRWWIVLDSSQQINMSGRQIYLNGNAIMRQTRPKTFGEFQIVDGLIPSEANNPGITQILNELDDNLEMLTGSRLGDSQGEYLDKDTLTKIYEEQMPEDVRKLLPELEEYTDKQFFDAYAFNESVLGTAQSRASLGMYSGNVITNVSNAITHAQAYLKPKNEYVNSVFDSMLSISSPNSVWSNISDENLLEGLLLTDEYKLVVLVDDKKYGMKVRELLPTSVKAIQKAKELGGWIIPTQTYKDMYNVVNHRLGSTGMAKLWSRIMYMYKFGYLCRPGAWIRNFIDTNLKSKLEIGDEFDSYKAQAHKILDDVDTMKKHVQRRSEDGIIKAEAIKEYFDNGYAKYLTYEQFLELDRDFLSQGISGNVMADLYKSEGGDLWSTFTEVTGNIIDGANKTENYNRLATYLYELDSGLNYSSALAKVAKTHFDYSFKSVPEQLVDMIFPFTTFSMRNYSYWIEMLEKHPWLMRNYVHLMKPSWDFKDYTPEELAVNKRVQTQILYGQLKLGEFNDKVLLFKLNPSVQDAIQMFSDPINNVYEKLAAPIAVPLQLAKGEYTNPTNLIPVIGPAIQSAQTMIKQGNPAPSVIGVANKPIKFSNPNLSGTDKYTDNTYRTPKYRNNIVYDSYSVKGVKQYRVNLYPIVDVFHDIQMRYSTNVYGRIKNRINKNVFNGIRYRIKLDVNRFR